MTTPTNYELLAADYAKHRQIHPGVLRELIETGSLTAESRVLEVGCGTGNYLTAIHVATGCTAVGIDPSDAMLAKAKTRDAPITWLSGRAEDLPVADGSIDLLFNVDVIHHVSDRPAFFADAMRALAPGGLICTVTDSAEDIARRRPLSSHFPETIDVELTRYPAIAAIAAEMIAAGFALLPEGRVELEYPLTDATSYQDRAFSSLHLISDDAHRRGIARLRAELERGPISALTLYTLIWARRP